MVFDVVCRLEAGPCVGALRSPGLASPGGIIPMPACVAPFFGARVFALADILRLGFFSAALFFDRLTCWTLNLERVHEVDDLGRGVTSPGPKAEFASTPRCKQSRKRRGRGI